MNFKEFVLLERQMYLSQKIGDILTSAQELSSDVRSIGTRDMSRFSERIVNQIRRLLHSHWPKEHQKYLKSLQKNGVALMKAIKEKGDLPATLSGVTSNLEKLVADMGAPINKLATDNTKDEKEIDTQNVEKSVKDQSVPPPKPKVLEKLPDDSNPTESDPNAEFTPPLGGSSGPLSAI